MAPKEISKDDNQNNKPANLSHAMANSKFVAQRKVEIQKRSKIPKLIANESSKVYSCPLTDYNGCDFVVTSHGLLSGMAALHLTQMHQVTVADLKSSPLGTYKFTKKYVDTKAYLKIKFDEIGSTLEHVSKVLTRKRISDVSLSLDKMTL